MLKRRTPLKAKRAIRIITPLTAERNRSWKVLVAYLARYRAKGLCEIRGTAECQARDYKPDWRGLSGHHIIPRARGRIDTAENTIIGCGDCHNHAKFGSGAPFSIEELQNTIADRT